MQPTDTIRTRFAPSPTGYLHLGSLRTALFAWLFARHHGGQFVLRIEDTDQTRSKEHFTQGIIDDLAWLGLDHDEPIMRQTERLSHYNALIDSLLEQDLAYYCDCSSERLDAVREEQRSRGEKPRYDGHCAQRGLTADSSENLCVRFRNPKEGSVTFTDAIRGDITIANSELDDLIIRRSDGSPTYNFVVVVDDADMRISHVIRGDDHINNTPRQINLMRALGHTPPIYAHVPSILGDDGKRLSKRHAATSISHYREAGYLPEAMLSALARLGWSHGDQELFSRQEMIDLFSLDTVSRSGAVFNPDKLLWCNQQFMQQAGPALAPILQTQLARLDISCHEQAKLAAVCAAQVARSKTMQEMAEYSLYFFNDSFYFNADAVSKHLDEPGLARLADFNTHLKNHQEWSAESLKQLLKHFLKEQALGFAKIAQPLRIALTGNTNSPSIDLTMSIIGRDECLKRIQNCLEKHAISTT